VSVLNKDLRQRIVDIIINSKEGHIPSAFSVVDIINYLYEKKIKLPKKNNWNKRDYFFLSKGHGCAALYVVLNKFKILSDKDLNSYGNFGSKLGGHPDMTKIFGVEASTGSLGHGLPTAVGVALGLKIKNNNNKVYCLIGDGECHEGSIWEAANLASNLHLNNLICFLDWNKSAQKLLKIENLKKKWEAFGWKSSIADGHSEKSLDKCFIKNKETTDRPRIIICKNIKGKGVSFIEDNPVWHHKIPNNEEYKIIKKELTL
jgi:transketolase